MSHVEAFAYKDAAAHWVVGVMTAERKLLHCGGTFELIALPGMNASAANRGLGLTHGAGHFDPTKAGMSGVSRDHVAKVVDEMSRGSKYYSNAQHRDKQLEDKIASIKQQLERTSASELRAFDDAMAVLCARAEAHERDLTQVWVVLDMDAFYAACEIRERPELAGVPMAVGGIGMISTANYAARKFGVRAAMPGFIARKLCPQLVFVDHHFQEYTAAAEEVRAVIRKYDPHFSAMSLDEAYICLTPYLIQQGILSKDASTHPADHTAVPQREQGQDAEGPGEGDMPELRPAKRARSSAPGRGRAPTPAETTAILAVVQQMRDEVKAVTARYHPPKGQLGTSSAAATIEGDIKRTAPQAQSIIPPGVPIVGACVGSSCGTSPGSSTGTGTGPGTEGNDSVLGQAICLTCSCGIGPNPMLAKIASNDNKPDGQALVQWDRTAIIAYMSKLPVRAVPGVGKVTEKLLTEIGLKTCGDVIANKGRLRAAFNERMSTWLLRCCLGISNADRDTAAQHGFFGEKGSNAPHEEGEVGRKSISSERTFRDCNDWETLKRKAVELAQGLAADMAKEGITGTTATLKMKLHTFEVLQRSATLAKPTADPVVLGQAAESLLQAAWPVTLRLIGFRMSGLSKAGTKPTVLQAFLASKAATAGDTGQQQASTGARDSSDGEVEVLESHASSGTASAVDIPDAGQGGHPATGILSPQKRGLGMAVVAPARHLPHNRALVEQKVGNAGRKRDISGFFAMHAVSASVHAGDRPAHQRQGQGSSAAAADAGAASSSGDAEAELLLSQSHESRDDIDIIDLFNDDEEEEEGKREGEGGPGDNTAMGEGGDGNQHERSASAPLNDSSANVKPCVQRSCLRDDDSIEIIGAAVGEAVPPGAPPGKKGTKAAAGAPAIGSHQQASAAHVSSKSRRGASSRPTTGAMDAFVLRK